MARTKKTPTPSEVELEIVHLLRGWGDDLQTIHEGYKKYQGSHKDITFFEQEIEGPLAFDNTGSSDSSGSITKSQVPPLQEIQHNEDKAQKGAARHGTGQVESGEGHGGGK